MKVATGKHGQPAQDALCAHARFMAADRPTVHGAARFAGLKVTPVTLKVKEKKDCMEGFFKGDEVLCEQDVLHIVG